jgi:ATP-dependent protease HslVU (ClpYQ) peptidase subunit
VLEAGAIVAAEMRRVHHLDGELVLLWQGKEAAREAQRVTDEIVVDAVAGQEADAAGRQARFAQKCAALRAARLEAAEVEGRKGFRLAGCGHEGPDKM